MDRRRPLQFGLSAIFVFMIGLGLACALVPPGLGAVQAYFVPYLVIGFGQACCSLAAWGDWRRQRARASTRSLATGALVSVHLGYWLTAPAWLLIVVVLIDDRWGPATLARDESARLWATLAIVAQLAALPIHLGNLGFFVPPPSIAPSLGIALARLAMLNLAHGLWLVGGFLASLLFLPDLWSRY